MAFLGGGNNKDGSPNQQSKQTKKRSILDYSITAQVVKAVRKKIKKGIETYKKRKVNTSLLGSADYQGDVEGRRSRVATKGVGGGNIQITSIPGSKIQKTAVKKAPAGPTIAELEQDELLTEKERLLKIKRKGRKVTKLPSLDDELTLSKKILLG